MKNSRRRIITSRLGNKLTKRFSKILILVYTWYTIPWKALTVWGNITSFFYADSKYTTIIGVYTGTKKQSPVKQSSYQLSISNGRILHKIKVWKIAGGGSSPAGQESATLTITSTPFTITKIQPNTNVYVEYTSGTRINIFNSTTKKIHETLDG